MAAVSKMPEPVVAAQAMPVAQAAASLPSASIASASSSASSSSSSSSSSKGGRITGTVLAPRKRAVCGTVGACLESLPVDIVSIVVDFIFCEWQLVSGSKECIQIWRGTLPDHPLYGHPYSLIQLADGRLASGAQENCIYLYSKPQTGKDHKGERVVCDQTLSAHNNPVWALSVLNDGRLVSGACERIIKVWDPRSGKGDDAVQVNTTSIYSLAVLNDGRVAAGGAEGIVEIWPIPPASATPAAGPTTGPGAAAAGAGAGASVGSSTAGAGAGVGAAPGLGAIDKLGGSGTSLGGPNANAAGGRGSMATPQPTVVVARSQPQLALKGHRAAVWALCTLPGDRLATGSIDRTIRIWDVHNGHCLNVLRGHAGAVSALSLTREGWLVSGSEDTTVKVWNTMKSSCECIATMRGHTGDVNCVAALPDGRIASGSNDKTIKIWTLNGVLEATLKEQTPVLCLAVMLSYDITTGSKGMKL